MSVFTRRTTLRNGYDAGQWRCRRCHYPSCRMFAPYPKPADGLCRACRVALREETGRALDALDREIRGGR